MHFYLEPGGKLVGSIRVPGDKSMSHRVIMLGAIAEGDIGSHFPPSDPQWRGAPSRVFLEHAAALVTGRGGWIGNIDLTIICEAPKVGPHREAMRQSLSEILKIEAGRVSVKATTTEKLGFTGRGEGIAAQAAVTVRLP